MKIWAAALALVTFGAGVAAAVPTTRVAEGRLAGVEIGHVASFKGVPFAAPPIGPLRWRPPQPARSWQGLRAASEFGPACLQRPSAFGPPPGATSEDCLTLNIWAPRSRAGRRPVMVWIHGGGFVGGAGSAAIYDGEALARRGVVVVTLNYRLGRFGFFAHPALSAEARGEAVRERPL